ncbi:proline dehydrogenase family protein [Bacillus sonorensis]|uniref:proline dehydrogenase family protein n=1 Tax=Bacillus sonorensis TaxID=119858 RepID=UPI00228152FB|nr:proline dehydrogenase family protein [Bacillus sonorensis]MCY8025936.1 proline dehydrogenase family protein [Bacillus sonorensis]MCY8561245.1 proline dehydrogenase family protein [Bacillus sonorensis]
MGFTKDFFILLSQNKLLNNGAKRWGLKLGAKSVVAGTNIKEMVESVKALNAQGISATIDNLGEFVFDKQEAVKAQKQILEVIQTIHEMKLNAHISLKPTQLGLDIEYQFCLDLLREIVAKAHEYFIFINFDMEDYSHLKPSFDIIDELSKDYDNIGTVIQAYFYESEENIKKYKGYRLRIVKGAYKEPENLAYQNKREIDRHFIQLIEYHLLNGKFTSIATHDHKIINHAKVFAKNHHIPNDKFEFQLLYGFRRDLQIALAREGYNVCTYVPFGEDWYGYFMRRLAERPQNLNLIIKQLFNKKQSVN